MSLMCQRQFDDVSPSFWVANFRTSASLIDAMRFSKVVRGRRKREKMCASVVQNVSDALRLLRIFHIFVRYLSILYIRTTKTLCNRLPTYMYFRVQLITEDVASVTCWEFWHRA